MNHNPSDDLPFDSEPRPEIVAEEAPHSLFRNDLSGGPVSPRNPVSFHQPTPMELLLWVIQSGGTLDTVINIQSMQERLEASERKNAFIRDVADFKSENIHVYKDRINTQYKSGYVSLGHLVQTVTPYLSKHNLSVRWNVENTSSEVRVTCILTHSLGHFESVSMVAPPDGSGSKNLIQQSKSTITYLRACTLECILGLASTDANLDDDGNGFGSASSRKPSGHPPNLDCSLSNEIRRIHSVSSFDELRTVYVPAYKSAKNQLQKDELTKHYEEMKKKLGVTI